MAANHQLPPLLTWANMLRVARTIADLGGVEGIGRAHVAVALGYRRRAPVN